MLLRQLLALLLIFGLAPLSTLANDLDANVTVYKIAVFIDIADADDYGIVEKEVLQIFHNVTKGIHNVNGKTFSLTAQTSKAREDVEDRGLNPLQVTRNNVCGSLINDSIAVVLYHSSNKITDNFNVIASTVTYALGFYKVPVIGVQIKDAEFSRKSVYPTFLRTTPPNSFESDVWVQLLDHLNYRKVVLMNAKDDPNAEAFLSRFTQQADTLNIMIQDHIEIEIEQADPQHDRNIEILKKRFEEITSNIIILYATAYDAEQFFFYAEKLNLTRIGKAWMVNEAAMAAKNLPIGVLGVKVRQNGTVALTDAFRVVKEGAGQLLNLAPNIKPLHECIDRPTSGDWTNDIGMKFYRQLTNITLYVPESHSTIAFSEMGDRLNVAYDIYNKQENRDTIVGSLEEKNLLTFDETAVIWPGGVNKKPLEITLPRMLRAITVEDRPFVYAVPIDDPRKCNTSEGHFVDDRIIKASWFPCFKKSNSSVTGIASSDDVADDTYCCAGYAIDMLWHLSQTQPNSSIDTGFEFTLHLVNSYGTVTLMSEDSNEEEHVGYVLTGMIGELDKDLADIAVGALSINHEREQYIDFSQPWLYHGIKIIEKWKERDSPMESFMQPFKVNLWMALLGSVVLVGCSMYVLDKNSPFDRFYRVPKVKMEDGTVVADRLWEDTEDDALNFSSAMWFVWGVLLDSGVSEKTPRSFSARVVGVVWCGFSMIMVASYTANLAAFLVLDQPDKALSGLNDPKLRNPAANFSFATVKDTNTYQYFKRSVELSTMFRIMEKHNYPTAKEAIAALLDDSDPLGAFIWDSTRLEYEASHNCQLRTRGDLFGRSAYGVGLQKNSPWTPHITMAILRMTESGIMEELEGFWISSQSKRCTDMGHKSPARLGLTNMRDVFILVAGGIVFGALLSFFEVTIGRRRIDRKRRNTLALRYGQRWRQKVADYKNGTALKRTRSFADELQLLRNGKERRRRRSATAAEASPLIHRSRSRSRKDSNGGFADFDPMTPRTRALKKEIAKKGQVPLATLCSSRPQPPCHNFRTTSLSVYCSRCRARVYTDPRPVAGPLTYAMCFLLFLLLLWPCICIPCCVDCCRDFNHHCPQCDHRIGRFRRGGRARFFV